MKLTKEQWIEIRQEIKENERFRITGLGAFDKLPRRKGKINGTFGNTPKYANRPKFTPYNKIKREINNIN